MMRVLGDSRQYQLNTTGRRVGIAWIGNTSYAAQSLPRDLSLDAKDGSLRQKFVPELQALRLNQSTRPGLQAEVVASWHLPARGAQQQQQGNEPLMFGVSVLGCAHRAERTRIGVNLRSSTVFVDGTTQGNLFLRAGPLLGSTTNISLHAYVDGGFVTAIFNEQVAITTVVAPTKGCQEGTVGSWSSDPRRTSPSAKMAAWTLRQANNANVQPL